ncbi:MAG: hypothetical protein QXR53_03325 [Candidatus Norongarragalinales archaeon]
MVSLAAIAYYAFLFVGGIGFGYFVLRLTKPDARLMRPNEKLGASAVYGFALFAIAFALDYFIAGETRFFEAAGFLPITLFFTILLSVFFLKVAGAFSKPEFLVVGVPAVKTSAAVAAEKSILSPTAIREPAPQAQTPFKTQTQPFKEITSSSAPVAGVAIGDLVSKRAPAEQKQTPQIVKKEIPAAPTPTQPAALPKRETPLPSQQPPLSKIDLQFEPRKKPEEHKKAGMDGFFGGIANALGIGKREQGEIQIAKVKEERVAPSEIAKQIAPKKQEIPEKNEAGAIGEDAELKEKELKKIKEAELEEIARELAGEEKGGIESEITHRRYLEKSAGQQKPAAQEKKKEVSEEEEFESMVQEVYNQLQISKTRAEVSDKLKLSPPPAEGKAEQKISAMQAEPSQPQLSPISLFSEEPAKTAPTPLPSPSSLFDQLNAISGGGAGTAQKTEADVKFVKIPANGAGCPRCHASNSRIVFCPYCGSGMCANCTPLITPKEDGFDYACPKCGENVFVKRQPQ